MNKEDLEYERKYSHSHCWNQGKSPACGQPLKNHKQCCLCDTVYKPRKRFPSQPNSEDGKMMYGHSSGNEVQFSHSPKPDENTYEKISKETERSARLASDKMSGYPLPDTTEEKKKHSMLCKSRNVDGKFYAGSYEGMKEPEDCDCHNNTSNEWVTNEILKILAYQQTITNQGINYTGEKDWALNKIKSLLSQSEQRVRKEMVEVLGKHNARILNYFQQQGTPDMPMIAYDERVCLIPAIKKATHETCDIINLISK